MASVLASEISVAKGAFIWNHKSQNYRMIRHKCN